MSDNFKKYKKCFQLADIRLRKLNVLQIQTNEFHYPIITLNFQPLCHGKASFFEKHPHFNKSGSLRIPPI